MNDLLSKIRSRGYWHVVVRPTNFNASRIADYSQLYPLMERVQVRLTDWHYPYINRNEQPDRGVDWVGQHIERDHFLEMWRFFQSGQFVHIFAIEEDWRGQSAIWPAPADWQPYVKLDIAETLADYTQIFEFAARLAQAVDGDDPFHISIAVKNILNRKLSSEDYRIQYDVNNTISQLSEYRYSTRLSRTELIATPKNLSLIAASELFKRLGWEPTLELLRSYLIRRLR